jgi:gamma-glutamyl hercynylcysteine S-oxide synthase
MITIFLESMTTQIMPRNAAHDRGNSSDRNFAANDAGLAPTASLAVAPDWRCANAAQLAAGLRDIRQQTLQVFDAYVAAGALNVPYKEQLNPPLWELGHLGWYQEFWIGRNPQRSAGIRYNDTLPRTPSLQAHSDAWYDSSTVSHASRWHLPLLPPDACKAYLAATLERTLALLATAGTDDDALYFYRLVLFHEAMHLEAAVYMAQALGVPLHHLPNTINTIAVRAGNISSKGQLSIKNTDWTLGSSATRGFVFDNELGAHTVQLAAFTIDAQPVSWGQYLAYVHSAGRALPHYVRQAAQPVAGAAAYEQQVFGQWQAIDLQQSAVHLSHAEALGYCAHVGRRLPTEAQWECAAMTQAGFAWGDVWEWTASTFAPFPGFVAHPYRDYSEPWFHTRPVLRGACAATQPMLRSPKYRNYFMPERSDIYAGFRTCSL